MARVFLVEDDPETGETVQIMLECLGHEVLWLRHGRDLVKALNRHAADLLITDILMPEMDGLEILRHVRELRPGLPLVAMTGRPDAPHVHAARRFGASRVLPKPFHLADLENAVREALGESVSTVE